MVFILYPETKRIVQLGGLTFSIDSNEFESVA